MTKIVCISDTHCKLAKVKLPDGDILVHAGDALSRGTYSEFMEFVNQLEKIKVKYDTIIYVPGNHDRITEENETLVKEECENRGIVYLNNTGIEIDGLYFYGSGITPRFHNWAWNRDSGLNGTSYSSDEPGYKSIEPYWEAIPEKTDMLITHGPPKGVRDISVYDGANCGCHFLLNRVEEVKPKYHIFGHIHQWHGQEKRGDTVFVNASICTEQYSPDNKPIVLEIKDEQ